MIEIEAVARVRSRNGHPLERLVCHPRLPLVGGWGAERPAVHVWTAEGGRLRELGCIGAESEPYGEAYGWDRTRRVPAAAWHPEQPLLVVAGEEGVARWTPAGLSEMDGIPAAACYRHLAFGPDGQTLWASPAAGASREGGGIADRSDAVDLATGTAHRGPWWDTGVTEHPGGGLVAMLRSDQGATLGVFARVDRTTVPATMRVLRRALILDADGYGTPVFSPDGRHVAIRGNAYDNSLEVFAFPSLERVLATTLGEPCPTSYPYPPEWLEQMRAWSRHNVAFDAGAGALWVGTPSGSLVEVDLGTLEAVEHEVVAGSGVTALAAVATGELVAASGAGELVLLAVRVDSVPDGEPRDGGGAFGETARAAASAFLAGTSEVPDDAEDLEEHLVLTDGTRTWESADLEAVTSTTDADPTWLRLQAAINAAGQAQGV